MAAFCPLVVPGTFGSASAATSAFLLVGAAALAGPALITSAFGRLSRFDGHLGPTGRLAVANVRGFSRRLTTVVVPLAIALTAGTAQTTVNQVVAEAGAAQLREGLRADLVVSAPDGLSPSAIDSVAALPGVTGTTSLTSAAARVLTDPEMEGVIDSLAYEPTTVRSLGPGSSGLLLDPGLRAGSLADLTGTDTVAISADASFDTGFAVGDAVPLRWADGTTSGPVVVAIYERGLGFGDYLVGPNALEAHSTNAVAESLLVNTSSSSFTGVRNGLAELGLVSRSPAAYAASAVAVGAADRTLSAVLLLALLAFVFLAAANALVMVTARRRSEFRLYGRTGATRAQLLGMTLIEAGLTGGLAWAIGTLATVPAVLGVGLGMLGPVLPPIDFTTYLVLSCAVILLPLLTVGPTAFAMLHNRKSLFRMST